MTDLPVVYRLEGGIAHLTMNTPHTGNALTVQTCELMKAHIDAIARDDRASVLLLSGTGKLFCVGGNLRDIMHAPDRSAHMRELVPAAHSLVRALFTLDKPIVVGVHGAAAGAGLSLALLADILIAEESTTFRTAYSAIGLTPDLGQSWLLPRIVGWGRALDLTLNNASFSADQAREWGMVTSIAVDARAAAQEAAQRFASGPAKAYGGSCRLIRQSFEEGFFAHLDREEESIVSLVGGEEAEGLITRTAKRLGLAG
jgi:2-(1,2-epoxy-1,2-dihydrophenyl)acetyl-CoA isomerase